jgi:hypothetical protein
MTLYGLEDPSMIPRNDKEVKTKKSKAIPVTGLGGL